MNVSLLLQTDAWVIALLLFIAMLVSILAGLKTGQWKKKYSEAKGFEKSSTEIGYLTGLLFFLLAFTFGMSGNRYDTRRSVVVEEANTIGTAILRADLYPAEERLLFRKDFKEYVEARIDYFEAGADIHKIIAADSLSQVISAKLWAHAAKLSLDPAYSLATRLMVPALNDMIDITTTRLAGEKAKVPESILWMLLTLACISAFYSGYASGMKGRIDWLVETGFCLLIAVVVLFTLGLDRPRRGFVTLDTPNQTIIDLRKNFE